MTKLLIAVRDFLSNWSDIILYILSFITFLCGLSLLVEQGKKAEAISIVGAIFLLFCKIEFECRRIKP